MRECRVPEGIVIMHHIMNILSPTVRRMERRMRGGIKWEKRTEVQQLVKPYNVVTKKTVFFVKNYSIDNCNREKVPHSPVPE